MTTWNDFRNYVDSRLAKLTPEGLAAVRQAQMANGNVDLRQKAADAISSQLGMTPNEALSLALLSENVWQRPDQNVQDSRDMAGNVFWNAEGGNRLPDRSAYGSEADYQNAVLSMFGLPTLAQEAEKSAAEQAAAAEESGRNNVRNKIAAFAHEMLGSVSANDPVYSALLQGGTDAAQASAGAAGLSGRSGLAGTQAASVAQQNVTPYLTQRKSLGLNALGTAANLDLNYAQLAQADNQYMQNRNDLIAGEKWKAGQNGAQSLGGTIGAVGGGILGAYFGGPQGAAMGAQAGYGAGSSLATLGQPSAPTYSSYKPASLSKPSKPSGGGAGF